MNEKVRITRRQREILKFINSFIKKNGYAPTYRDIQSRFDIAVNAVRGHINSLEKKGFLTITRKVARGIRVSGSCPYCGKEG